MILCGGDSFSKFTTPLGQYTASEVSNNQNGKNKKRINLDGAPGLSAVELLMKKYNTIIMQTKATMIRISLIIEKS